MQITVTRTYIGAINIPDGKLIATDPCYEPDIWCNQEVEVRKGHYLVFATYGVVPDWGERVITLEIVHEDMKDKKATRIIGHCAVDSGQCGFFESKNYRQNHPNKETAKSEAWYNRACKITLNDKRHNCGVMGDYGAVSESGIGDGYYDLYAGRDKGEIVALRLRYL